MIILPPLGLDLLYEKSPYISFTPSYTTTGSFSVTISTVVAKYRYFGAFVHIVWKGTSTSTPSGAGGISIGLPITLTGGEITTGWNVQGNFSTSVQNVSSALLCHNRDNTTPFTANGQDLGLTIFARRA